MKCPNCDKKMKHKSWYASEPDFGGTADEHIYVAERYKCKPCGIKNENGAWHIPKKFLPTGKQVKTILFIENRLGYQGEALTKTQASKIISQSFEEAKRIPLHNEQWYEDMQEEFGMDQSDFC